MGVYSLSRIGVFAAYIYRIFCWFRAGLEPGHYIFQFIVKSESAPEKYLFNTLEGMN